MNIAQIKIISEKQIECIYLDEKYKLKELNIDNPKEIDIKEKDLVIIKDGNVLAKIEEIRPAILKFLSSSIFGEKTAEKIVDYYEEDFIKIMDLVSNNYESLEEVPGIGKKKAEGYSKKLLKLINGKHTYYEYDYLYIFLLSFEGIQKHHLTKLITRWKTEVLENLFLNPYEIVKTDGIGFKTADALAIALGWELNSENRLLEGINFAFESLIFGGGAGELKYPKDIDKKNLSNLSSAGHTFLLKDDVYTLCFSLLSKENWFPTKELIFDFIDKMEENGDLIYLGEYSKNENNLESYTIPSVLNMEKYIFEKLKEFNLKNEPILSATKLEAFIKSKEQQMNCQFSEKQKEALFLANEDPTIMVVGGYAGTGKTTATKAILSIFDTENVIGCALSGIAANKIRSSSGYEAKTIHSLLGISSKGTKYNEENKLNYEVIIVDESSMVDLITFYKLFKAIDFEKTKLIMLGDPGQLPPVGCGDVFKNIIDFEIINSQVVFDKVFRQNEDQVINIFAQEIRKGKVPSNYGLNFEDFNYKEHQPKNYWLTRKNLSESERKLWEKTHKEHILKTMNDTIRYYKKDLINLYESKKIFEFISYFQILSPTKVGLLGTENINEHAQFILNPILNGKKYFRSKKTFLYSKSNITFRVRDKVIHLKNQNMQILEPEDFKRAWGLKSMSQIQEYSREERVFNGQIGVIIYMAEKRTVTNFENIIPVYYPSENYVCLYKESDFNKSNIALGYAISIHKSQGSEFDKVLMPSTIAHYYLLSSNLLYTAVTRAKKKLIIAGEERAFASACKKKAEIKRNTVIELLSMKEKVNEV